MFDAPRQPARPALSTGIVNHRTRSHEGNVVPLRAPSCSEYEGYAPAAGADLSRVVTVLGAYRWLTRDIGAALTDRETVFLLWVIDRTVGWQKWECTVTYRLLAEGDKFSKGLGKSERQLRETVAALAEKGVLRASSAGGRGLVLAVNFEWRPEEAMLPIPKRMAEGRQGVDDERDAEGWGRSDDEILHPDRRISSALPGGNRPPFKGQYKGKLVEDKSPTVGRIRVRPGRVLSVEEGFSEEPKASLPENAEEEAFRSPGAAAVDLAALRKRIEGTRKAANADRTGHRSSLRPVDVLTTWRLAFEDAFADVPGAVCPATTVEDRMKFKASVISKWTKTPEELHEFIDYTVRYWPNMIGASFKWMKANPPPAFPSLRFFMAQKDNILAYWSRRARNTWLDSFDKDDQSRLVDFTLRGGLTHEEALTKRRQRLRCARRTTASAPRRRSTNG